MDKVAENVASGEMFSHLASRMIALAAIGVVSFFIWYARFRASRRRLYELAEKIPGPPGLPLLGHVHYFVGSAHEMFRKVIDKAEEYLDSPIRIWIGPRLLVFLTEPRDAEIILSSQEHIDKATEYRYFKPWLGNGLLISTGELWRNHRRLIQPTFHHNVLRNFIELFNDNSLATCEKLRTMANKEIDIHDYMSEATVEMLLETAMGVNKKTQTSGFEYAKAVMRMCDILHLRHTKFWLRPDIIFRLTHYNKLQKKLLNIIHSLTKRVIKSKKYEIEHGRTASLATFRGEATTSTETVTEEIEKPTEKVETDEPVTPKATETKMVGADAALDDILEEGDIGAKKRLAFLDQLIEISKEGKGFTDTEIKEQVDTIMFEGHDTTAAGSSFFLSMMGIHKDIQAKVIEEMDTIFGDSDRPVTYQDTMEMKYLERCLFETLRMYPPVPVIARSIKREVKMATGDYVIPVGATVVVATFKLHRRADQFPNPDKFNPDNFLPENCAKRHYYTYVPFSAGPRSCVGRKYALLKLKILLATIMRNFTVESDLQEEDFQLTGDIILKRAEGFKIRLIPREKKRATASA